MIRILLSSIKNSKKNLDSYCFVTFVTSLWLFILEKWCKCTFKNSFLLTSWRPLTKIPGSGSISQREIWIRGSGSGISWICWSASLRNGNKKPFILCLNITCQPAYNIFSYFDYKRTWMIVIFAGTWSLLTKWFRSTTPSSAELLKKWFWPLPRIRRLRRRPQRPAPLRQVWSSLHPRSINADSDPCLFLTPAEKYLGSFFSNFVRLRL